MESNDFNEMPKDALMVIGDIDKFTEFIIYNSVQKAVNKLLFSLFEKRSHVIKLIEKYILRHNISVRDFVKDETNKYIIKSIMMDDVDIGEQLIDEMGVAGQIKRGDIDSIVIKTTNDILFKILDDMCNDKLIKLCWDAETEDFVWLHRHPNEQYKVETQYKSSKKKATKKKK